MGSLYLLVARGGSKGVPRKNLRTIGGKSLIAWKIAGVRAFDPVAKIVCSTEGAEIAIEAASLGCTILERPAELASDTATTDSVVMHAIENIKTDYDKIFLLEPSSPFTGPQHYKQALEMRADTTSELILGMRAVYPSREFIIGMSTDLSVTAFCATAKQLADSRRQAMSVSWTPNGALYLFAPQRFIATGRIYGTPSRSYGLLMDRWSSHEIEDMDDLAEAEWIFESGRVRWPL